MVNHMRHNSGQTGSRRGHDALKATDFTVCEKCSAPRLKHVACPNCGTYKGRVVLDTVSAIASKAKKAKGTKEKVAA